MKKTLIATVAALGCFALANQVLAQSAPAPGAPRASREQQRESRVKSMCEGIDARLDGRLTYIQSRLKITDKEKTAWDGYAKAMRSSLDPLRKDCASGAVAKRPTSLPERLTTMERIADQRAASIHAIKPATETLYAALTPDQQKIADRVLLSNGPRAPRGDRGGPRKG